MRRGCTVLVAGTLALGCSAAEDTSRAEAILPPLEVPDAFTPVVVETVSDALIPVPGSDYRYHLVYELRLTNTRPVPARVERIEVLDSAEPSRILATLRGEDLRTATRQLSMLPPEDDVLAPNESVLVLLSLSFATKEEVPTRIVHRIAGTGADNPGATAPAPFRYLAAPREVWRTPPPSLGPPLAGDGWLVANGCCSTRGAHRTGVLPISGELVVAQRFAIDFMRIDGSGRLFEGDPSDPANWHGYGAQVLAVADGTVVEVLDGLPDQRPGALPDPTSISLETVDGNHVILDIGEGHYAFYAHLRPGSIRVREGERVLQGQVLAELGNTGNTSAPHLHLHVMRGPSALADDGVPYVFDQFEIRGSLDPEAWYATDDLTGPWTIRPQDFAGTHVRELPLDLRVIWFPNIAFEGPAPR